MGSEELARAELVVGSRTVEVTVERGDALAVPADVLALKYAQAAYGVDREFLARLGSAVPDRLPAPGEFVTFANVDAAAADIILLVGTPGLDRFGYSAVRSWASRVVEIAQRIVEESVETIVVTIHGVRIGGSSSLDEESTLVNMVAGFRSGLASEGASPSLREIRIVERQPERANRLADVLGQAVIEDRANRAIVDSDLSRSVSGIRGQLEVDLKVTASQLAAMVQQIHPDYGGGRLRTTVFDETTGPTDLVDLWIARVVPLYQSVRSGNVLLDGRRLIAGLAALDGSVRVALERGGALAAIVDEIGERPSEPARREDVALTPDEPTDKDQLGRRLVARALVSQLVEFDREHAGRSFMFLIDGPWGAGKSTLLDFVRDEVCGRAPAPAASDGGGDAPRKSEFVVARFDAWRQSSAGPPWLLLMLALRDGLQDAGELSLWHRALGRLRRVGMTNWLALVPLVGVIVVLLAAWGFDVAPLNETSSTVVAVVGLVVGLWPAARAIGQWVSIDTKRGARGFVESRRDPMEDVADHFRWLRDRTERPLLLLIDDLDRCDPAYVVELLDNVQKLVRTPSRESLPTLIIGVAADGRWLREAYQRHYAEFGSSIGEPGRPLGSLFLDKLFQLTVPVPELSPSSQEAFLAGLLRSDVSDDERRVRVARAEERLKSVASGQVVDTLREIDPEIRREVAEVAFDRLQADGVSSEAKHALERFAGVLEPNPRSVRRFTMAFSILRAVRTAEGNPVSADELALWTIVTIRWPLLADFLARDPDAVRNFRAPWALDGSVPSDLHEVFAHPGPELRAVFNHETGGPLGADTIRRCVGIA